MLARLAIYKNPVTVGEYVTFLRGLAEDDIAAHLPGGAAGTQVLRVDGLLQLGTDLSGYNIVKDLPVVRVSWSSAVAFAQTVWPGARLPSGVEWEKAARGVDGRRYPMGNYLDPTWAVLAASLASSPRRQPVTALSYDVSPYNVRGMAGNVRDWCADSWRHQGETDGSIHQPQWNVLATTPREVRGGCYTSRNQMSRCASRMVARPTQRLLSVVGFRPLVPEAALRQWAARD